MFYFLNGGYDERGVLRLPESLKLYRSLGVSRLVVIPYAIIEDEWQRRWHDAGSLFEVPDLEIKSLTTFDTDPATIRELLEWADFVYLPGGAQKTLLRRMKELGADTILHDIVASGSIKLLGGGSAGAMVMGNECIVGTRQVREVVTGLNFIPDTVIDSHFSDRQREPRLQVVLSDRPQTTGIGIDENTAFVMNAEFTLQAVFGSGTVSVYQANSKVQYDSDSQFNA